MEDKDVGQLGGAKKEEEGDGNDCAPIDAASTPTKEAIDYKEKTAAAASVVAVDEVIWDCGSPLYHSYELASVSFIIEKHLMFFLPSTPSSSSYSSGGGGGEGRMMINKVLGNSKRMMARVAVVVGSDLIGDCGGRRRRSSSVMGVLKNKVGVRNSSSINGEIKKNKKKKSVGMIKSLYLLKCFSS